MGRSVRFNRRRTVRRPRRAASVGLAAILIASLISAVAMPAQAATVAPPLPVTPSVKDVTRVVARKTIPLNGAAHTFVPTAPTWPVAASSVVQLPPPSISGTSGPVSKGHILAPRITGTNPVMYAANAPVYAQASGESGGPTALRVTVASHQKAVQAGITGVLLGVAPTAGSAGQAEVGVDYSGFADAYGGGYADRLVLASMPACALTTPKVPACRTQTPLPSHNDLATQSVSAQVSFGAAGSAPRVLAATTTTAPGDGGAPGGSYTATSLKPAGSWSAGGSSGSFTYSYPMSMPPAPSSLVPTVSLDYDSGSVDGQTAASQAQPSWVGDGWSSSTDNFVEQSFVSCSDSPEGSASPSPTGDSCYDGPVLTLSLDGSTTSLVPASSDTSPNDTTVWKSSNDNGEIVKHIANTGNGSGTKFTDYWTVTDRTDTTFTFGRNELPGWTSGDSTTNSVQSEPVYSAHAGDPCYNSAGFAQSACTMAYRWNLDYVTDIHGNAMAYYYKQDTNGYAQNNNTSAASYVRDAHLDHIDYGFTDSNAYVGHAPDQVVFTTADRCVSGTCDPLNSTDAANWPDVPEDLQCAVGAACQVTAPAFYSTVRLSGITTRQWNGSAYVTVDSWSLTQSFPATGDGYTAALWLGSITHTGADTDGGGSAVTLPSVSFSGIALANRTDIGALGPLNRFRISAVTSETGSVTGVDYELVNPCAVPVTISPSANTSSCFPVSWTPNGYTAPITDWFNKWAVKSVTQADNTSGTPTMFSGYTYLGGGAWHYDDNEVVQAQYRTWGQWRGYGEVQTRTGQGNDPQTLEDVTYYRGMDGDTLPSGSRSVTLTDSQGGRHTDADQLAGETLEDTSYLGDGGPIDHSTITSYWVSAASASRSRSGLPALTANVAAPVETWARQAITDTTPTTWRVTETDTSYDANPADPDFGLDLFVYDHGDVSDPSQAQCTTTTYTPPNTTANLVGLAAETEVDAQPCGGANPNGASAPTAAQANTLTAPMTLSRPADVISDTRTFYDNPTLAQTWPQPANPAWPQAAPTYGDPSVVQKATDYTGGAFVYQTSSATTYDSYGRTLDSWDANGNETQTAYTMTNGLTSGTTVTNPAGQTVKTTVDTARGLVLTTTDANGVVTTKHYDALGRLTAEWDDSRATSVPANKTYSYTISTTAPTVVTTNTLNDESGYNTSTQLYDALMRPVQTQDPTPQGGRLVTNTFYDTHGWVVKKNNAWWDPNTTPNGTLVTAADNTIPNQDLYTMDGLGRTVVDQSEEYAAVKQTTTTIHTGDRVTVIPPTGGVAQSTVTDALGRTTELDQYTSLPTINTPANTFTGLWTVTGGTTQATLTKYNHRGQQSDVIDPAGDDWSTTYNLLGQITGKQDPDAGASTMSYDAAGNVTSTTDANGHTISYVYDNLNRKRAKYNAPDSGQAPTNELASWTYDGPASQFEVGKLVSATAYVGGTTGTAYTETSDGYNVFGESLGETYTIPATTATSTDSAGQTTAVTSAGTASLAGSYTFGHQYTPTTGLPSLDIYPSGGGLVSEAVGYSYVSALDEPSGAGRYASSTSYDAYRRVTQEQVNSGPNFAYITNTYDPHTGKLTDTAVTRTTTPVAVDGTSYAYDPAGNITSQTETRQGATTETQCYTYDGLDRLTQAWTATDQCKAAPTTSGTSPNVGDGIIAGAYWTTWTYNALGQRTQETDHSVTGGTDTNTTYTYNGNGTDQPTTLTGTSTTGPNGSSSASYGYDKTGNTTTRTLLTGPHTLTWTNIGILATDTSGSTTSSYVYDADGNVLLRQDGTSTTLFLPTEQLVLNTSTKSASATRFITLPGGGQAVKTAATYYYEIPTDQHGTSTLTLDATAQNPTWRQFTPYGAPRGSTPATWPDQNGFLNDPTDPTDGLTTIGARQYDPTLGQFVSLDPQLNPNDPQSLNGYTYSGDNPITTSDPSGLCPVDRCGYGVVNNGRQSDYGPIDPGDAAAGYVSAHAPGAGTYRVGDQAGAARAEKAYQAARLAARVAVAREIAALKAEEQRLRAQIAATKQRQQQELAAQAEQENIFSLILSNGAALLADGVAVVTQPVPGLDVAVDAGAGYLDEQAVGEDTAALVASGEDVGAALETSINEGEAALQGDEEAVTEDQAAENEGPTDGCTANSFIGTTPVLMADGTTKPIDQVHVGDMIENAQPGALIGTSDQQHQVTAVHVTHDDRAYTDVTIETGPGTATITGTAYHLYWDATTRTWTQADQLRIGDHLQSTHGTQTTILALRDYTTTTVTYNLTINTLHTYYIQAANTPVLVHNCGGIPFGPATEKVQNVLNRVRSKGAPFAGYKGGSAFNNTGAGGGEVLPELDPAGNPVTYREWDVNSNIKGVDRGPERLVTGSDGSAYYTGDHYMTFLQIP